MALNFVTSAYRDVTGYSGPLDVDLFTILLWFRLASDVDTYNGIFQFGEYIGDIEYEIVTDSDGTTFAVYDGPNGLLRTGSSLSIGQWYHAGLVVQSGTNASHVYLNGTAEITFTANTGSTSNDAFAMGMFSSGLDCDVDIAAVKGFARALTAAEVQAEMWQYAPVVDGAAHVFPCFGTTETDYGASPITLSNSGTITLVSGPPIPWRRHRPRPALYTVAAGGGGTSTPRGLSWIHRGFNPQRSTSLGGELH